MAEWIDGAATAPQIPQEVAVEVARIKERSVKPGLAVVMVGDDQASHV
jgi:methylenetetrahydrofolate dehydrogenase (NADP+) / methenyltetrahydrofolate cyclohydrolase